MNVPPEMLEDFRNHLWACFKYLGIGESLLITDQITPALFGSGKAIDPVCTNTDSKYYIQRSGLFSEKGADVRPAERHHNLPKYQGKGNGMRVCITLPVDGINMSALENLAGFQ